MIQSGTATKQLADELRLIYESDRGRAETLIMAHLEERMKGISVDERSSALDLLTAEFETSKSDQSMNAILDTTLFLKFFSLIIGERVSHADLSYTELSERLAACLNTIFDTLNELVHVINEALFGENNEDETIRKFVVSGVEGENGTQSLVKYLDQIKTAFLISQKAFQDAAQTKMSEVLVGLDPDRIAEESGGSFKLGPLRKAELFEIYKDRFNSCKKWFDSGRFTEEFLREFEKNCRRLTTK
ncbi:MAG: hypothetical protein SVY10_00180 [Thermodesulfobacteriota bacterium]|nr:hypothetical protein [Thermodesulfobacteriota bacterium]